MLSKRIIASITSANKQPHRTYFSFWEKSEKKIILLCSLFFILVFFMRHHFYEKKNKYKQLRFPNIAINKSTSLQERFGTLVPQKINVEKEITFVNVT